MYQRFQNGKGKMKTDLEEGMKIISHLGEGGLKGAG
jgi:hypothetical protein